MLKKAINSEGIIVVGGASKKDKFLPGFSWHLGGIIYTVTEVITKDPSAEMRRVSTSDGRVEDMEIFTIEKDLQEKDCHIITPDTEKKVEDTKEKAKKKVKKSKKKTKKTKRNKDKG